MTEISNNQTSPRYLLKSIGIKGYRPFHDFTAQVKDLEVIVGANGSGKSALFEFLRFLRNGMSQEIPPEIIEGAIDQRVFHSPGPERFDWHLDVEAIGENGFEYAGGVIGPVGKISVYHEVVTENVESKNGYTGYGLLNMQNSEGVIWDKSLPNPSDVQDFKYKYRNRLALGGVNNPNFLSLYNLRDYIGRWRFYSTQKINSEEIRRPVLIEPEPVLREDAGNLSAVLHYMMTEHQSIFEELQYHLRSVVPGFKGLTVKAYGGRGQVGAFWREGGVDDELTLADLSDGIQRLICWFVVAMQPNLPSLICIDEPDQGVHPRTLPILAGMFEKAATRTQIFLATHSSYFLTQFDISRVAVMRKENGEAKFLKPSDSRVLTENLKDFGPEELELMHRRDELELLA